MVNNTNEDTEFDFTKETYTPIYDIEDDEETYEEVVEKLNTDKKIKRFFSKKNEVNKKFMIYDDGDVQYINNDTDINYKDVINKSSNKIKEKTQKYSSSDFFRLFLICYLFVLPLLYYKYYYSSSKNINNISENIQTSNNHETSSHIVKETDINNMIDNEATITKPEPLDGQAGLNSSSMQGQQYYDNLANEIAKYNNSNITNIRLYFNNRYNRGALKTSLEKNLTNQKSLYVHIESNKSYYKKQHDNLDALLDVLLADIATSTELLEQIDGKFTRDNVDAIFNKYHNEQ